MARQSGLGRGLTALIPTDAAAPEEGAYRELRLDAVVPNRYQPRETFDEEALAALTASILELGVLQPVLVRDVGDGTFELIAGERRWRACRRAGLTTIPAIVRSVDDETSLTEALVENLQRDDLDAMEEAAAFQQLIDDFGFTHDVVATRVGKSRSAVSNSLRLLQLPAAIQGYVVDGRLSAGHARALLGCPDADVMNDLAGEAMAGEWSVRALETAVRALTSTDGTDEVPVVALAAITDDSGDESVPTTRPAAFLELEELLSEHLATRVRVETSAKHGRVVIDFATLDDLERIYRRMVEST